MSIKLMSATWELDIPSAEKMVLLCLADYAGDHGAACWPSIETIARKCSKTARAIQYAIKALEEAGWLRIEGRQNDSNIYHLAASKILRGEKIAPVKKLQVGVKKSTRRGEKIAPKPPMNHQEPPEGITRETWLDFLTLRKSKKAPLTETALRGIKREADKAGWSLEQALQECCQRGWQGFKASWVQDRENGNGKRSGWLAAA